MAEPLLNRDDVVRQLQQIFPNHSLPVIEKVLQQHGDARNEKFWPWIVNRCIDHLVQIKPVQHGQTFGKEDTTLLNADQKQVASELKLIFPDYAESLIHDCVRNPDNNSESCGLLQKCIDDLLEGRTAAGYSLARHDDSGPNYRTEVSRAMGSSAVGSAVYREPSSHFDSDDDSELQAAVDVTENLIQSRKSSQTPTNKKSELSVCTAFSVGNPVKAHSKTPKEEGIDKTTDHNTDRIDKTSNPLLVKISRRSIPIPLPPPDCSVLSEVASEPGLRGKASSVTSCTSKSDQTVVLKNSDTTKMFEAFKGKSGQPQKIKNLGIAGQVKSIDNTKPTENHSDVMQMEGKVIQAEDEAADEKRKKSFQEYRNSNIDRTEVSPTPKYARDVVESKKQIIIENKPVVGNEDNMKRFRENRNNSDKTGVSSSLVSEIVRSSSDLASGPHFDSKTTNMVFSRESTSMKSNAFTDIPSASSRVSGESRQGQGTTVNSEAQVASPEDKMKKSNGNTALAAVVKNKDNLKDQNFQRSFLEYRNRHCRRESLTKLNLSSDSNSDKSAEQDELDESFDEVISPNLAINHTKSRKLLGCRKDLKRKYSSLDYASDNEKLLNHGSMSRKSMFMYGKLRKELINQKTRQMKYADMPSSISASPNSSQVDAKSPTHVHRTVIHQSDLNESLSNMSTDTKRQELTNSKLSTQGKAANLPVSSTCNSTPSPYKHHSTCDKDSLYRNILATFHETISRTKLPSEINGKAVNTAQSTLPRARPTLLTNKSDVNMNSVLKPTLPCSSVRSSVVTSPTLKTVASVSIGGEVSSQDAVKARKVEHITNSGKYQILSCENGKVGDKEHPVSQARKTKSVDKETDLCKVKEMREQNLFSDLSDDADSEEDKGLAVSDSDTEMKDDNLPTISFRKKHREKSFNSPEKQLDDLDKKLLKLYSSVREQNSSFSVPGKQNSPRGEEHEIINSLQTNQDRYRHALEEKQNPPSTVVSSSTCSQPGNSQAESLEIGEPLQRLPQSTFVRFRDPTHSNRVRKSFSDYRDTPGTRISDIGQETPGSRHSQGKPATVVIESTCKITYSPEKYQFDIKNDHAEQTRGINAVPTLVGGIPSVSLSFPGASSQLRTSQNYSPGPSQRLQQIPVLHSVKPGVMSNTSAVNTLPVSTGSPKMSVNSTRVGPVVTQTCQDQCAVHRDQCIASSNNTGVQILPQPSVTLNTLKSLNSQPTRALSKSGISSVHSPTGSIRTGLTGNTAVAQVGDVKSKTENKHGTADTVSLTTVRNADDDIHLIRYEPAIEITDSPEDNDIVDVDVTETRNILDVSFEEASTFTANTDTAYQGIQRDTDTVEYVETKTPQQMREELKNQVLNIFPDVDPQYLEQLCLYHTGNMALNNICFVLSDNQYPRAQPKGTQEPSKPTKASPVDYFKQYQFNTLDRALQMPYIQQCHTVLFFDFPWISVPDIRRVSGMFHNSYAPTYKALKTAFKQICDFLKKDTKEKKNILRGLEADVTIDLDSSKRTTNIRLLKNKRNLQKLSTLMPELQAEVDFVKMKMKEQETEKDHELAMQLNEQEYETEGQGIECGCCFGEYPFDNMVQCLDGHLFCEGCLGQYAKESVFGQGKAQLLCMTDGCTSSYPKSQLEKALPSEVLSKYEDRVAEESLNLADIGDLVRCPHCDFAAIMDPEDKVFTCMNEMCRKETCRHCKEDWSEHFGKRCEEIEKRDEVKLRLEYEEKMTKAKVRTCHKCKAQFTKEDGCNKMTCRCSAKMCYICRKPNINYSHFCQHPRDPGKPCTKCNACSLWTNPEEDDNRAVAEIQKEAAEARKSKGYTEDKVVGVPEEPPAKKMRKGNTI